MRRSIFLLTAAVFLPLAGAAWGIVPEIRVEPIPCFPTDENPLVWVTIDPMPAEGEPMPELRTYFRRETHGNFYYVLMQPGERNDVRGFWAVLPKPEDDNAIAEYYVNVLEPETKEIQSQTDLFAAEVRPDDECQVDLTDDQGDFADNLTVGETIEDQRGDGVVWWQCEGLDKGIDVVGETYDREECLAAILWWHRPELIIPLGAVVGGGIVVLVDQPQRPVSPVQP